MSSSQRIIVNTIAQYTRTIINVSLSLYSTRLVLSILGQSDYGIFSVIAGVIAMLSFVTNALTTTTQRYLSLHHGRKDADKIKQVFGNSCLLHLLIGSSIAIILVILGPWITKDFLNIDINRQSAAMYVYIAAAIMLFFTFINAPIRALFIARENIVYTSVIDVIDGILRLVIAVVLSKITCDQLVAYSSMLVGISIFNILAFAIYATIKYPEFHLPRIKEWDKAYIRDLSNFAGWTVYSAGCIIARNQGIAIVLNLIYGTVVNSAYGIAQQVSGAVQFVSTSIMQAMNPQIMKAEGRGERERMIHLSELASKYAFLLLSIVAIPLITEMNTILEIWLDEVPKHASMFCRFILIAALCDQISIGLTSANQAIGKIKNYNLVFYTLKLLVVLLGWILLKTGHEIVSIMWCYVIIELLTSLIRLPLMKQIAGISIRKFCQNVFARIIGPLIAICFTCWLFTSYYTSAPHRIIVTCIISCIVGAISTWIFALGSDEKAYVKALITRRK